MEKKKLLIVGIDPGITTAYAILDIEGKVLRLHSSKQLELNKIISDVVEFGKGIIVGTDKAKAPNLAETLATKLGARIIAPQEDLGADEKKRLASNYNFEDDHQEDALASALFARRQVRPLLDKIDYFAEHNQKQDIKDRIRELVITKKISIKNAASLVEKKDEESKIIDKVIVERKLSEFDFLKLYDRLKRYESEIRLVRKHNSNLLRSMAGLEDAAKRQSTGKTSEKPDFRDRRIKSLEMAIKSKEAEFEKLRCAIRKLNRMISRINDFYILKKLDNLGIGEFNFKNKLLNVGKNDILLVDNPNIVSGSLVDLLKGRVFLIVHKKPVSAKVEDDLPFIFMDAKNLNIEEERYFGFVGKKQFEAEKSKIGWVRKIVEDYKKEKGQLINPA